MFDAVTLSAIHSVADQAHRRISAAIRLDNFRCPVRGAIIDYNDFKLVQPDLGGIPCKISQNSIQRAPESLFFVVGGNDNRQN
jgi:hypothetical protein